MKAILMLITVVALAAPGPVGAQEEGVTSTVLALTAEQFSAYWPGCNLDERAPTVLRCGEGVRARLADGRVAEVMKAFDPPVGLVDAKAWMVTALPSEVQVEGPATIDTDLGIVSEQFTSVGLGDAIGTSTIVVRYVVTPDRDRITSVSVNAEGR
jgi:hypothetical protein